MRKIDFVRECAEVVREWAEEKSRQGSFFSPSLCGLCAHCTGHLHMLLKAFGIPSKICINDDHVFLSYRGQVVDVTATQFGFAEKVLIKSREQLVLDDNELWTPHAVLKNEADLVLYQRYWPMHQVFSPDHEFIERAKTLLIPKAEVLNEALSTVERRRVCGQERKV